MDQKYWRQTSLVHQLQENGALIFLSTLIEPTAPMKPTIMNKVEAISKRNAAFEVQRRRYNIAGIISVSGILVRAPHKETKSCLNGDMDMYLFETNFGVNATV